MRTHLETLGKYYCQVPGKDHFNQNTTEIYKLATIGFEKRSINLVGLLNQVHHQADIRFPDQQKVN